MVKCIRCGQDFINEKQFDFIKKRLGSETHVQLCVKCKRIATAEKFKDIYKNTPVKR